MKLFKISFYELVMREVTLKANTFEDAKEFLRSKHPTMHIQSFDTFVEDESNDKN